MNGYQGIKHQRRHHGSQYGKSPEKPGTGRQTPHFDD